VQAGAAARFIQLVKAENLPLCGTRFRDLLILEELLALAASGDIKKPCGFSLGVHLTYNMHCNAAVKLIYKKKILILFLLKLALLM
jgi:hypothetical protein